MRISRGSFSRRRRGLNRTIDDPTPRKSAGRAGVCRKQRGDRRNACAGSGDRHRRARLAGPRRRGHQNLLAARPGRSRRLSDDRRRRRSTLRRQGEERAQTRCKLSARRRPYEPHRADDFADRRDGIRIDRNRDRSAAAGDELHQTDEAALQCVDARRQIVSVYFPRRRSRRPADCQTSRRARSQGRLFRTVRQRLGGEPYAQRAGARLSAAFLHGQLFRKPHTPLPALPNQTLLGAMHGRDRRGRLCKARQGSARLSLRQEPGGTRSSRQ